jgi:hypothetical protein
MDRANRWSHLWTAAFAVVLCGLPLFNLLGYESSAAMGVVLGLAAFWATTRQIHHLGGLKHAPQGPVLAFFDALPARLSLSIAPLLILGLNALRVRNCDPLQGITFWFVIPLPSLIFGHGLAWACSAWTRRPALLGFGLFAANTAWFFWKLATEPPITGHHWLFGWFAGSIYDEALALPKSLLAYRGILALELAAALMWAEWRWRRFHHHPVLRPSALLVLSLVAAIGVQPLRDRLGIGLTREDIAETLGGTAESEHFVFFYDPGEFGAERLNRMIADHEFRYAELQSFFDEDPVRWRDGRKVSVYIYPNQKTQQKLFGSRKTFVARPWTHEMHIRWDGQGDTAVAHELSHLFTAPFGGGPLQLATRGGLLVDIGLVEGIALAADWPPGELDAHEAAAAMRTLGIAPDIRETFAPMGFWQQPAGKAYTLMGSFVRWLVETHGIERFKKVYGHGDWEGVYGVNVDALITDWELWIDQISIDDQRLELARHRYRKGSIFKKPCARALAELRRKANDAEARGDWAKALALRREVLGHTRGDDDDKEETVEIARLHVKLKQYDEALTIVEAILDHGGRRGKGPRPAERARIEELQGDIYWRAGNPVAASDAYGGCLELGIDDGDRRRMELKTSATLSKDPVVTDLLFEYLLSERDRTHQLYIAMRLVDYNKEEPLWRYLVGLQLVNAGEPESAIPWLIGPRGTISIPTIDDRRIELLAQASLAVQDWEGSRRLFTELLESPSSRARAEALEGLDRVRFALGEPLRGR